MEQLVWPELHGQKNRSNSFTILSPSPLRGVETPHPTKFLNQLNGIQHPNWVCFWYVKGGINTCLGLEILKCLGFVNVVRISNCLAFDDYIIRNQKLLNLMFFILYKFVNKEIIVRYRHHITQH